MPESFLTRDYHNSTPKQMKSRRNNYIIFKLRSFEEFLIYLLNNITNNNAIEHLRLATIHLRQAISIIRRDSYE